MASKIRVVLLVAVALAVGALVTDARANTVTINFDEFTSPPATCCYADTGVIGPLLYPQVTITDADNLGYVMNSSGWDNMETSPPNLFGTTSGTINLTFSVPVSNLSLDVINGTSASDFTLASFDASDNQLTSVTQYLNGFTSSGSTGRFSANSADIWSATIVGNGDFAIDTISFDTGASPVPEPSSFVLLGFGLGGLALAAYRRKK